MPPHQIWFTKAVTSINGPFDPIELPIASAQVDYEAELVVIIGKRCKHVPKESAADVVFGYCAGNDVSVRDWQMQTAQWVLGKSFDTHAPIGPWIVTADEIGDPHTMGIRCFVNGERRQNSNTAEPRVQRVRSDCAPEPRHDARARRHNLYGNSRWRWACDAAAAVAQGRRQGAGRDRPHRIHRG